MRLPRVFRTATFRLVLIYIVLFGVSAVAVFAIIYWSMARYASDQIRAEVEVEASVLANEAQSQGIVHLVATVEQRAAQHSRHPGFYLVLDSAGRPLAGAPVELRPADGWVEFNMLEPDDGGLPAEDDHLFLGKWVALPDGAHLFVAQDTYQLVELRESISRAFVFGFGASLAFALLGGVALSYAFLKRIEAFNRSTERIVSGSFAERIPVRGTDDELDRLAGNLNRMLERIQVLMSGLREVSSDVAHDLRTPMTRLLQRLEAARSKATSVVDYETAVDQALVDMEGILLTFSALLRIAQIESGSRKSGFGMVDLSSVFQTIAETYAPVAEDQGQVLAWKIETGVAALGDRELLTQMLANVVENAIRHNAAGTSIEIALESTPRGIRGVVSDTGVGIPIDSRTKVFQRFHRLDTGRTTSGSGLGLSLVAAVAELHGILVTLEDNQPGLRVLIQIGQGDAVPR